MAASSSMVLTPDKYSQQHYDNKIFIYLKLNYIYNFLYPAISYKLSVCLYIIIIITLECRVLMYLIAKNAVE